jgi:hypothetical protein
LYRSLRLSCTFIHPFLANEILKHSHVNLSI